jgi:hypothetical protein
LAVIVREYRTITHPTPPPARNLPHLRLFHTIACDGTLTGAARAQSVAAALPGIEETFLADTLPRQFPHPAVATLCAAMGVPVPEDATHPG